MVAHTAKSKAGDRPVTDMQHDEAEGVYAASGTDDIPLDGVSDNRQQLTKLSLGLMGCQPELSVAKDQMIDGQRVKAGRDVLQAIIFGEITGLTGPKELPNAKTEAEKFTYGLLGRIEGVNAISGEMFKAAILYLPGGFHDMFLAEIETQLKAAPDGHATIVFALEFYSIPANNPRGYSWKAKNKMPIEKRDPLARLRARALAGTTIKQLEHVPSAA
jgi:hypothetical protein